MVKFIENLKSGEDVEAIMERVNLLCITSSDYVTGTKDFDARLEEILKTMRNDVQSVDATKIVSVTGESGFYGKLNTFFKKIIRKLIIWYMRDVVNQQNTFNTEVTRLLGEIIQYSEVTQAKNIVNQPADIDAEFYQKATAFFENASEQAMLEKICATLTPDDKIVHLGCGDGRFLEYLAKHGFKNAIGIEDNMSFCDICQKRSVKVFFANYGKYVESLDDSSIDAMYMGSLADYIPFGNVYKILQEAKQKLSKNGRIIFDRNVMKIDDNMNYRDYLDGNKIIPLHPNMLKFVAEYHGFQVEINEYCIICRK